MIAVSFGACIAAEMAVKSSSRLSHLVLADPVGIKVGPRDAGDGRAVPLRSGKLDDLMAAGVIFCGTPDQVHDQVVTFDQAVGGFGNLLMMGQAGALSHDDTVASMTLFARDVLPRLKDYAAVAERAAA